MICFADNSSMPRVREMWKICFGDSDAYIDLYFSRKYKNSNTLVYFDNGEAVASLQILPYNVRFYRKIIPCGYISGVCTLPKYRGQGYMASLLVEAIKVMQSRNIPLSILVPAEDSLFGLYGKYGYEQTFEKGFDPIELKQLLDESPYDMDEAYRLFDLQYQQNDFCVLKTREDFNVITEEYILDGCPVKYNLGGMSRILDIWTLLGLYAKRNPRQEFRIRVTDRLMSIDSIYYIRGARVELLYGSETYDIEVDIALLSRLLWGFRVNELPEDYRIHFRQHKPIMNLMLE